MQSYSQRLSGSAVRGGKSRSKTASNLGLSNSRNSSTEHLDGRKTPKVVRSAEIIRLDELIHSIEYDVTSISDYDPCFCFARKHALSQYTPICQHCGLILCELHPPSGSCPFCHSPLLSPSQRSSTLLRLRNVREEQLRKEEQAEEQERLERLRMKEEAAGRGLFPTLTGAPSPAAKPLEPHKVLSLNSRTGQATLSTFSKPPSRTQYPKLKLGQPTGDELAEKERMKPVKLQVEPEDLGKANLSIKRPWYNTRNRDIIYIAKDEPPEPANAMSQEMPEPKKSRQQRKKEKASKIDNKGHPSEVNP